jgi:hypothetical protein
LKREHDHLLQFWRKHHSLLFYRGVSRLPYVPFGLVLKLCIERLHNMYAEGQCKFSLEVVYHGICLFILLILGC